MVVVRRFVLSAIFSAAFCAQAWAANPDCARFNVDDPDHFLEATFAARMSQAIGCDPPPSWQNADSQLLSTRYLLDLPGGEESQILSAYYVVQSLKKDRIQDATLEYLFSGYDARRLDAKKLEAEIVTRKLSPESATNVRALFKNAQERNAWMIDGLGKMKNANYDYNKLFIQVPEAAAVAWQKFYEDHKDVYALGTSIERQLSKTGTGERGFQVLDIKGCGDMHKAFKQYLVSTQKGKLPPEIEQFLQSDPLAFEMLGGLSECDALHGAKVDSAAEFKFIENGRFWRGPRTAAYWAALAASAEMEAVSHYSPPISGGAADLVSHKALLITKDVSERNIRISGDIDSAKVATVKKSGDGWVLVTFKIEKWMEPDMECVDVKPLHFNHWGQDGHPVWDWKCHVAGYHEKTNDVKPHSFSEVSMDGVKPGMIIKMRTGWQDKEPTTQGFPLEVSIPAKSKKDKPKLISFSGIQLQ